MVRWAKGLRMGWGEGGAWWRDYGMIYGGSRDMTGEGVYRKVETGRWFGGNRK